MHRYLRVDNHPKDELVNLYLTLATLVRWPTDIVSEDVVNSCFPLNLLLEHSYATFMLLAEVTAATCIVR